MKKRILALAALAALVPAAAAFAGGFGCDNACPLARQANAMRSFGNEATAAVATPAPVVERNLSRI